MVNVDYWLAYAIWWVMAHFFDLVAFGVGLLLVPALSWYGPHPWIGETLAKLNATIAMVCLSIPYAGGKLYRRVDGSYELRPIRAADGPDGHTTTFAGVRFGWDYERVDADDPAIEEYGPGEYPAEVAAKSIREEQEQGQAAVADGGAEVSSRLLDMHRVDITRGGVRTFFDPDDLPDGDGETSRIVSLVNVLGGYENAGGINIAITSLLRAMPEYGGDSGGLPTWAQAGGFLVCLAFGVLVGLVMI